MTARAGPAQWGPPVDRPQHVALWTGRTGDPLDHEPDAGLLPLTVDDVLAALASLDDGPMGDAGTQTSI